MYLRRGSSGAKFDHPLVLTEPKPEVVFSQFGDSTLNFELRVVIPSREKFSRVVHELNMAIDAAFREQGIEIAFPQRELHIRNLDLNPAVGSAPAAAMAGDVADRPRSAPPETVEAGTDRDRIVIMDSPAERKPAGAASVFKLRNIRGSEFDHSESGGEVSMPT